MIRGSSLNRDTVLKYLSEGVCKVYFKKVTNGRFRSLYCTLGQKVLPRQEIKYLQNIFSPFNNRDLDLVPVYDIVDGEWKSFRITNVIHLYTQSDLMDSKTEQQALRNLK